jgi:hypothetical protein
MAYAAPATSFDQIDKNHDGVITREEFAAMQAPTSVQTMGTVTYGAPVATTVHSQLQQFTVNELHTSSHQTRSITTHKHGYHDSIVEHIPAEELEHQAMAHTVEIPHTLTQEKVIEKPVIEKIRLKKEVLHPEVHKCQKEVIVPEPTITERRVPVPHVLTHEQIQEVEVPQSVDLIKQVPMQRINTREKRVPVPEFRYQHREVEVPHVMTHEQLVEHPVPGDHIECIKEVPRQEMQVVHKQVEKPVNQYLDVHVPVEMNTYKEVIQEVPHVEIANLKKQIPRTRVELRDKQVAKLEIQYVEKVVEVPQIIYEERIVEVPQVEIREVIKQVNRTEVQFIDKRVPKKVLQYVEKIVEVPQVIYEERGVLAPQIVPVEAITKVQKAHTEFIPKEVPKTILQIQENHVDVPLQLNHERPVEVTVAHPAEYTVQVPSHSVQHVEKHVPKVVPVAVDVHEEVPHIVREEKLVAVPQDVHVEAIKQVSQEQIQHVAKHIPYVEARARNIEMKKNVELVHHVPVDFIKYKHVDINHQVPHKTRQIVAQTRHWDWVQVGREEVVTDEMEAVQGGHLSWEEVETGTIRQRHDVHPEFILGTQEAPVSQTLSETYDISSKYDFEGGYEMHQTSTHTRGLPTRTHHHGSVVTYGAPVTTIASPVTYGAPVTSIASPVTYGAPVTSIAARPPQGMSLFNAIDANHDGIIDRNELAFYQMDANHDGSISRAEFAAAARR